MAFLSASDQVGGAERALLDLVASLRAFAPAWPLTVVVPGRGPLAAQAAASGAAVRVLELPAGVRRLGDAGRGPGAGSRAGLALGMAAAAPGAAAYLLRLGRLLAELAPAVVHTNGLKMHLLGAMASPRSAAVVWHLHDFTGARPAASRLLARSRRRAAGAVAVSRAVAEDAARLWGARPPVRTVYNAVDLARFAPAGPVLDLDRAARLPPAAEGTVRVGLVATLGVWKGHEVFLRALAALPPEARVRGYVVGGAIYRTAGSEVALPALRRLADELGIAGRVGFTGFVEDAAAAMRGLDVVVHASTRPEPFGLVIAEGMACGRAVVASAAGGAAEIVTSGQDALAVPPGDAAALANVLSRLAADPALRRRLGAGGRETALARFDRARLAAEVAPLYRAWARG